MIKKKCKWCNNDFLSYRSHKRKYCSPECASKGIGNDKKKSRKEVICKLCGKKYKVIKSRLEETLFCSRLCHNTYYARFNNPNPKVRVIVFCHYCGKDKEVNRYQANSKNKHYCDINCKAKHQRIIQKGKGNNNFGKSKYTKEEYDDFLTYKHAIRQKTYSIYKLHKNKINPDKLLLGSRKYHIDHKFSIHDGFHNNVPVSIMSNVNNLQILYWRKNLKKGSKSDITLKELMSFKQI